MTGSNKQKILYGKQDSLLFIILTKHIFTFLITKKWVYENILWLSEEIVYYPRLIMMSDSDPLSLVNYFFKLTALFKVVEVIKNWRS